MSARRYRTPALLALFIAAGWAWDFALGGGRTHSIGWLIALVVVGGVSVLIARSRPPDAPVPPASAPVQGQPQLRIATPDDFGRLVEIEVAADKLFEVAGYGSTPGPAEITDLANAELLLVAGDPAVGYLRLELVDGEPHIEGLSVRPKSMRQGIGSALVNAACDWAEAAGYRTVTLCTFVEVPWNGPFYTSLGFVELAEPSPALRQLRRDEIELGLDRLGERWVMVRDLATAR